MQFFKNLKIFKSTIYKMIEKEKAKKEVAGRPDRLDR
jgi:hypothetical protein